MFLFYSNNILIYHINKITNYLIENPALRISPKESASEHTITITAKSKNFLAESDCKIDLKT